MFFTHDQTSDDGLTFKSEIHVDLGEKYRGVVLANELPERAYGTTHVFQLKDLIPLQNPDKARVVFLVFASYVDEPFILNPDASYLERHDVHEWSTGGNTGQAGYAIYLPGFELQFADDLENHLIFSWDLQGLIEVYDNNTEDDLSDDLVTLRLDDPFPIEMYLETEYTYEEPAVEDRIADDVTHVEIEFFDLMEREIAIGWVNPSDPQYLTTHVVRKVGSAPASLDDGELLYSGTFPMFKDMEVELGQHYYYRIFTESRAGLLSEGKVIDIITSLPDIIDMEFIEGYKYRGRVEEIDMAVGEEISLSVSGRHEYGTRHIVVDWVIDQEFGLLRFPRGHTAWFKALKPGETEIIANYYNGLTKSIIVRIHPAE